MDGSDVSGVELMPLEANLCHSSKGSCNQSCRGLLDAHGSWACLQCDLHTSGPSKAGVGNDPAPCRAAPLQRRGGERSLPCSAVL